MNIDLAKVVCSYPDSLKSRARLRAIMRDLYPDQIREMNVLLAIYESGILKQMVSEPDLIEERRARYVQQIQEDYGIKKPMVISALRAWVDACQKLDVEGHFKSARYPSKADCDDTENKISRLQHKRISRRDVSWRAPEIVKHPEDIDDIYDVSITDKGMAVISGIKVKDLFDVWIPPLIGGHRVVGINKSAFRYENGIRRVVLPEGVEYIDDDAFGSCNSLSQAELPHSLKWIGKQAFSYTKLRDIKIPDTVTTIEDGTFYWCTDLQTVRFSEKLTKIDMNAFFGCQSLQSVLLPRYVKEIGRKAFYDCKSLRHVRVTGNPPFIGEEAFSHCPLLSGFERSDSRRSS